MTTNLLNNLSNVLKKGPSETQKNPLAFEAQSAAEKSNRVLITCLSRVNLLIKVRCMRYAALLLVLLLAGIGNAWGASVAEGTYNFVDQTIGAKTKFYKIDNGIYQYRLNAYTRNTSYGIQLPASGDGTGFAFHLESTQKVYIGLCKKSVKAEVVNNLYIKTITKANFDAIEAGSNNSTTVTLTLGGSATLSQNYTFAALGSAKTEGATVYMGELPAGYYYVYGNSTDGNGNLYSISFGTQTLFLVPNDKTASSAKFAIYYFPGNSGYECIGWSDYMTVSPCNSSTYRADIPKGYTKLIFVRLNPSGGRDWDSKWNQTGNLTFDGTKDLFTWANGSWDGATTTWSASTKYTISFAANGGTNSMSNVSNIACGRSVTLDANAYEKSGYTFAGWKTNVAVTANGSPVAADGIVDDEATISNITSNITLTAQWNADVACTATQPGALSKGTLSGCSRTITASGSAATNNTWYWQSSASGTDKSDAYSSGKAITEAGTYYLRSFCSDGAGCWSDAVQVTITAADMTPAAPTALAKSSVTAKGVTLTVTDAANTNDYEFYVSTSSSTPSSGTTATHSVTSAKSLTITNLYAGTKFYAWARAKCGSNKSAWTALTDDSFTTSTVSVTHTLTNVTETSGAATSGVGGSDYTAVYEAASGYSMPTPTVTIGGNTATSGTDYTWTAGTGTLTINANKINGDIDITMSSPAAAPSSAVISGTYHYFPGENISLTCTPSGNNGPTTYQWYKGGKSDEDNLIDGATSATYTKNSCAFADAGSYYCKVTCNATSIWAVTNSHENYDVKILRLYVKGSKGGQDYGNVDFVKVNSTTATASISLGSNWTYGFNIADGCGHYYGNSGTMQYNSYGPWVTNQNGVDCGLTTTNAATYVFTINYSNLEMIETTVTFPSGNQTSGKVIYFDNNDREWTNVYYRIGKSDHVQSAAMTKVYGTANLYQYTTPTYNNFSGWHITNAAGATGSYSVYNTKNGTAITEATAFEGAAVTQAAVTVTPTSSHATGETSDNNNCEFYTYGITTGMKTQNVEISPYTNGTITVAYTDTENAAQSFTSGSQTLAHTVIITPTVTPATGYQLSSLTINGAAHTPGNTYTVTGTTTVAATFAAKNYTVTLDDNGGTADGSASVTYNGTSATITTAPTYAGHAVDYYMTPDGHDEVLNPNGSFYSTSAVDGSSHAYITDSKWVAHEEPISLAAHWKCNTPEISCSSNTITITVPSGATVYYTTTTDGSTPSDPTSSSTAYNPSSKPTISADTKIKAIAIEDGCTDSEIASEDLDYEESCPTGGDIFTLEMDYSSSSATKVPANSTLAWSDSYGDVDGGTVTLGNKNGSSTDHMQVIKTNTLKFGGNDGYVKIDLDCPLKTGDVISFTSEETNQISFTKTDTRATSPATSSKKWTVTAAYNNVSTIYIWRASGSTVNLHTINITRPVTVTFDKNGGSSVSPTSTTYDGTAAITLPEPVRTDYRCTGWNTAVGGDGTDLGLPGETYRPNVTTSTQTIYAQWVAKSCASGTIYKFLTKTDLTNGNLSTTDALFYVKTSDYLANLTGGRLQAYAKGSNLTISDKKNFKFSDNNSYLLLTLDCPLRATDHMKWTVSSQDLVITKTSTRATTITLATGDGDVAVPEGLVGATQLWIWKGSSSGGKISYFEITRSSSTYNVTYDGNDQTSAAGTVPTDATNYAYNATVTTAAQGSLAKTNYTFGGWNTADDGTGTNTAAGSTFSITDNTTLYAKWTQAVTLDGTTNGGTDGSATAVWNATALTGITHATPPSGNKLTGYYTAATEGVKVLNADGTYASSNVTDYVTSGKWSRTGAAPTLYAQYESSGDLIWNLTVNSKTAALETSSKTSSFSEISTSNMTNAAGNGVSASASQKANLTGLIETPAAYDGDKYVKVTFQVADGYKFTPSNISVKVQPKDDAKTVKLELVDGSSHSISYTSSSLSAGSIHTVTKAGDGTYFTGTVTLKIYCYGATSKYRLGTPITISGAIEEACATMPTYTNMNYGETSYTVNDDADAISIVGGENIDTYQWKWNSTNDRTSGTNVGTNSDSYTPPTTAEVEGTRYYWCEMTNTSCGLTIKSPAVAITVSSSKSDATVTWTNPASTPNYGGGGYTIKATVDQSAWNGTLSASCLTAPAGIRLYNVTTGTTDSKKWIQANFDVQTAFDRENNAKISFVLSHDATATYNAISDENEIDYSACTGGSASETYLPVDVTHIDDETTVKGGWLYSGTGWIRYSHGGSSLNSSNVKSLAHNMGASNEITKYYQSSANHFGFYTESAINGVRLYVYTSNTKVTVSGVYIGSSAYTSGTPSTGAVTYDAAYYNDDDGLLGATNDGCTWVEITFANEVAAGKYGQINLSGNVNIAGMAFISSSGSGASLTTTLSFATAGPIAKTQSSANFTNAATVGTYPETLGAITYSSSNTSCATVNSTTGEVAITASGESDLSTTITATLAASGCYKGATATYVINVPGVSCSIEPGTLTSDVTSKCSTADATLTLTGFESGATVQWYKGESTISDGATYAITTVGTTSTLVTKEAGTYSVMVTNATCSDRSNSITITNVSAEASAEKIVDSWYIKYGRLTPDIALWTLGEGATMKSVAWSPSNATGLSLTSSDGVVYLEGKEPSSNTSGADIVYTLTLTVTDPCNTDHELTTKTITITHQKNTDKHVLAFVVEGTGKGSFTEGITAAQTTSVPLYNEIAKNFDVLATNIYSTDDEKKIKEYYSQFDILCVTDYPNTGTKGVNKKSYVDALGSLIDIRPILTMEAFVSKLDNWKEKGISGTPESPSTRQYTMDLQCKDHEIFAGTELTKIGSGDDEMFRVTMVDNTKEDYATLDASYTPGSKDYNAGGKPALQGFTFTSEMADADLLPLGLIDDGAGNDLQVGIERQHEMSARLMVLGINSYAMERLTDDGETVVINALKYLMKKNEEDIADCSTYFYGGAEGDEDNWHNVANWTGNTLPVRSQKVRIMAPCVIKNGETARVAEVKIIPSGKYNHGADDANGSLTIEAGGALIVDGKVLAATAPNYYKPRATTAGELAIGATSTAQGALIFDNKEGETNATVAMYSASYWDIYEGKKRKYWSYVAIPIQSGTVGEYFYNGFSYLYDETSGWIKKGMYTELHAFEGLGISMQTGNMEYFHGPLAPTTTQEITLTNTPSAGNGENLIGNSWTAPIQIANFEAADFGSATANVMIYSTGRDDVKDNPTYVTATVENDGAVTAGQWVSIPIGLPGTTGYDGLSVIPAMQAFQVNTTTETTLTLDYDKLVRNVNLASDNLTEKQHAPQRRVAKKNLASLMRIRVSGTKTRADVWLLGDDRFSEDFDNGWEAAYVECDARSPQLYANSELGKMAFLARPDLEGTVLGVAPSRDGNEYLFTFHYVGDEEYYLNDLKLKKSTLINEENRYTFTFEEGDTNRFYISKTAIDAPSTPTGVGNTDVTPKAQKVIYQDKVYILRNGRIYSADGRLVR